LKKQLLILLFSVSAWHSILAQADKKYFFVTWGYNRATYATSDIHFSGNDYRFTLKNVVAKDRQTPLTKESIFGTYLNLKSLTIPQFNCHIGRRLSPKWAVMIGWDHAKYVMQRDQTVKINGEIGNTERTKNFAGVYQNQDIKLSPDFLTFEHTDGYNLVSIDVERFFNLYRADNQYFNVIGTLGAGAVMVVPRSDVRLFGIGKNHPWNISGEGILVKASLQLHFTKRLFLETQVKTGYTYLHAIPTTGIKGDKAQQGIGFLEGVLQLGFKI
jgi:hypothetical protein